MNIQEIYKEASIKLGMSENDIKEIYDSYWYFIRNHITNLPLKENLNKNAFDSEYKMVSFHIVEGFINVN